MYHICSLMTDVTNDDMYFLRDLWVPFNQTLPRMESLGTTSPIVVFET
jgi:hypothetical protein